MQLRARAGVFRCRAVADVDDEILLAVVANRRVVHVRGGIGKRIAGHHCGEWIVGGIAGVFVAAFLGDKIRALFHKNKPTKEVAAQKHPMILKLWNKYGIIGLGFLGTVSVGAPISIAVGVGLNANIKKLVSWCCIGVLTRCIVFTLVGYYGLQLF